MKKVHPDYGIESPRPGKEVFGAFIIATFIAISMIVFASAFGEYIDIVCNKYPVIPIAILSPVMIWAAKRCYNRIVK